MVFCGIAKMLGHMDPLLLTWNHSFIILDTYSNIPYVVIVNLLGGISMIFHSIRTFNFKPSLISNSNEELVDDKNKTSNRQLNRPETLSGSYIIILSLWFVLYLLWAISSFLGNVSNYLFLLIVVTLAYASIAIIPLTLVAKNLALNKKIARIEEKKKIAQFHARRKAKGIKSRR